MPLKARSFGGSLEVVTLQKFQLEKDVLIFLPDPTFGAGGSTTWSYEILEVATSVIKANASFNFPTDGNFVKVALAPALFSVGEQYRVRIFDSAVIMQDEWFFTVYTNNFGTVGPINTATVNEYAERLAGLLGRNATVVHDVIDKGIPTTTTITIFDKDPEDPTAVILYRYTQRKFLDETHRVIGEVSARVQ